MRAICYIRVSDEDQAKEGYSIEAQETLLRRECAKLGYEIVGMYVDEGYSAKNTKRPQFQKMLSDIDQIRAQVIFFWRLDRFTRNSRDFQKITESLEKKGCGIKSATENIDTTTAMGRFQLELTISLGQLERETTAERVHFVMEERHRKGLRNGAIAPLGYDLVDGQLVINEKQAEIVRSIYELYKRPLSTRAIAKLFNNDPVTYPHKDGRKWSNFSIGYILTNPVYCGKLRWNYRKLAGSRTYNEIVVQGAHEPIISEEEFNYIQQLRNKRFVKREKVSSDFHFTGVLRCARCGYGMIGVTQRDNKTGKSRRFYRCLGRVNYGTCNMPYLSERAITEVFLSSLHEDSEQFKKLAIIPENIDPDPDYEQDALKRDLDNILKRRKKWQEAFAADAITIDELKSHMEEERIKEEMVRAKLEPAAATIKSHWSQVEIMHLLSSLRELWYQLEDELAKKAFIQDVFKEIIINTPVERGVARPGKLIPVELVDWKLNI
jgi:site-specific DNA recombinase